MRCNEVQQRISDSLDGGQPLDGELRRHMDGCMSCAAFERDCRELHALLTAGRSGAPVRTARRRLGPVPVISSLAAAAIIVLALLPLLRLGPRPIPKQPRHGPQPTPQLDFPQDLAKRTSDIVETVAMAPVRREMASLADDARAATRLLLSCLPSPPPSTSTRTVQ